MITKWLIRIPHRFESAGFPMFLKCPLGFTTLAVDALTFDTRAEAADSLEQFIAYYAQRSDYAYERLKDATLVPRKAEEWPKRDPGFASDMPLG